MVTIYSPAFNWVAGFVLWLGVEFHMNVNGAVPPAGVAVADPLLKPKPVAEVAVAVAVKAVADWLMVTIFEMEHPLASVTVTVYTPGANPVAVAVVFTGEVFQL
jgi:hypothetical protein